MFKIIKFIKDVISPKKCYSCSQEWHFLCPLCMSKISTLKSYCYLCKKESNYFEVHNNCQKSVYFDKLIINNHYNKTIIKKLIKDSKFYGKKDILEDFAFYLKDKLIENENIYTKENYIIIPVPMNFFRKLKRWYNHSDILAKELSKLTWIEYNDKFLKRVKNTKQQSKLSKIERELNLKNVFLFNKKYENFLDFKKVILVDDVVSTWSTINEVSRILKENWVLKVVWLCIASD